MSNIQIQLNGVNIGNDVVVDAKLFREKPEIRLEEMLLMDEEGLADCVADLFVDFLEHNINIIKSDWGFSLTLECPRDNADFAPPISIQILFCIDDHWQPCEKLKGMYSPSVESDFAPKTVI